MIGIINKIHRKHTTMSPKDDQRIQCAIIHLKKQQVVALPTESIYGLSAIVTPKTVNKIIALKKRSLEKGFIVISRKLTHLMPFIDQQQLTQSDIDKLSKVYQQPTTWVVPSKPEFSWLTGQFASIAIRLTRHPLLTEITTELNEAIISTSANISDYPPAKNIAEVNNYFGEQLDYIYPVTQANKLRAKPSQIIDLLTNKIIRS